MLAGDQVGHRNFAARRGSRGIAVALGTALALTAVAARAAAQEPGPIGLVKPLPGPAEQRLAPEVEAVLRARSSLDVGSGARAYGMGGAFLARADDATAASWNPAGLSYLRRPELSLVGARNTFSATEVRPDGFVDTESGVGRVADFVAATYPVSIGPLSGAAQVSYQRAINFTTDRFEENPDIIRTGEATGGFDVVALGTGFRVFNWLRLGGTLNRWMNGYTQTFIREPRVGRTRGRVDQVSDYELSGWNANVGVIWEPFESLNLGVVGKTPFTADVSLRRERTDFSPSSSTFTRNSAGPRDDVRLDLPGALGVGASWRPVGQLTLSADYTRTFWSRARIRNFFTLAPTPEGEEPLAPEASGDVFSRLPYPTFTLKAFDAEQIRAGVEYVMIHDRVRWPIRAGYFTNRQTFTAADGTAPRFNGGTLGLGMGVGPLMLDVAFVYEKGDYLDPSLFEQSLTARRVLVSLIYRHLGPR